MPKLIYSEYEDYDAQESKHQKRRKPRKAKLSQGEIFAKLVEDASDRSFNFSYNASRHERQWMLDSLTGFYDLDWFSDILRLLKGGKEASVYQCLSGAALSIGKYLAAKVYRPRRFRNLKNDVLYREGRGHLDADGNQVINGGMLHAMKKRTEYGRQLLHTSWLEHEYQTMQILYAAGVDIPKPLTSGDNAILMEYIGGDETPAPTLSDVSLDRAEAADLFKRVLRNIELMLSQNRIHADLSAFNILYWEGRIYLIDFPQSIHPHENRNAYMIFERDVLRVCEYFSRQGIKTQGRTIAREIWKARNLRIKPDVHPSLLDEENPEDRDYWRSLNEPD